MPTILCRNHGTAGPAARHVLPAVVVSDRSSDGCAKKSNQGRGVAEFFPKGNTPPIRLTGIAIGAGKFLHLGVISSDFVGINESEEAALGACERARARGGAILTECKRLLT